MSTTNMGLATPTAGVTADPAGSQSISDNMGIIDVHDHSSGKGKQVPSAGIGINADLSFAGYRPYNLKCASFTSQTSSLTAATNKPCIYVLNGELRYIDSSSNDVQITSSGSVAGSAGNISGLVSPAAASFGSGRFTWQSNNSTGVFGIMAHADLELYTTTAGVSNKVTIKSPVLSSSYTLTLPTGAPGSTLPLSIDSGGAMATMAFDTIAAGFTSTGTGSIVSTATAANANTLFGKLTTSSATPSDAVGSAMTSTGSNAISAVRTRSTGTTVGSGGIAISNSCSNFSTTSGSATDVTNLTVTITTSGRPVYVGLTSDANGSGNISYLGASGTSNTQVTCYFYIVRDSSTNVGQGSVGVNANGNGANSIASTVPGSSLNALDAVAAGTYTYKVQAQMFSKTGAGTGTAFVYYSKLVAYEL